MQFTMRLPLPLPNWLSAHLSSVWVDVLCVGCAADAVLVIAEHVASVSENMGSIVNCGKRVVTMIMSAASA